MEQLLETAILVLVLFFLLGSGLWIGLSLLGVALVGMWLFTTRPAGDAMITTIWTVSSSWTLTALPLFIWMGEILFRTRLSEDMFRGLAPWVAALPGRLLHTNIVGCTLFAAVSGSSAATCATIGKMTIPELARRGYPDGLSIGTLAGAGTLGLMIPPSLTMIVYGVAVNESIAALFMAGVFPGLVLALLFMGYVALRALLDPRLVPAEPVLPLRERLTAARSLLPVLLLILAVLGSIYTGIATATEAAALGVVGALLIALGQGALTWSSFTESLVGAVRTSCMIAFILMGAAFLSLAMGFTGIPRALAAWIAGLELSPLALIAALTIFYVILGCFLDGISAIVLTMAVIEPMIRAVGIDLLWFGVFVVVVVEMAQITPPVGFNLFVLQGMTGRQITWIARHSLPFFFIMVAMVAILVAFPELATWLPTQMRGGG